MKQVTLKFKDHPNFRRFIATAPALFNNITPLFLKVTCLCSEDLIQRARKEFGASVIKESSTMYQA